MASFSTKINIFQNLNLSIGVCAWGVLWHAWCEKSGPGHLPKPVIKQRTDALPSGLFLLNWTPTSIKALQPGKITSLKTSPAAANCYKNTRCRSLERWGWMEGFLMIQRSGRDTESVLSVIPSRNTLPINDSLDGECYSIGVTNCRYLLWLWARVSGSLPASLSGSQGFDWLLHLTMHNPPRSTAVTSGRSAPPMKTFARSEGPTLGVLVQWWGLFAKVCPTTIFLPSNKPL